MIERVAPADPLDGHPAALQRTVFFDGLQCVFRTGRGKLTAGALQFREIFSVKPDH